MKRTADESCGDVTEDKTVREEPGTAKAKGFTRKRDKGRG